MILNQYNIIIDPDLVSLFLFSCQSWTDGGGGSLVIIGDPVDKSNTSLKVHLPWWLHWHWHCMPRLSSLLLRFVLMCDVFVSGQESLSLSVPLLATDADSGENSVIIYSLLPNQQHEFIITTDPEKSPAKVWLAVVINCG